VLQIGANSRTDVSATSGRGVGVPRLPGNTQPKFCLISNQSSADNVVILPTAEGGFGSITTATGTLLPLGGLPLLVNTSGAAYIMHRSLSGTPTVRITPLADGSPKQTNVKAGEYAVQPTNSLYFGIGTFVAWMETDDNFITLVPTANTAGFSVSYWYKVDGGGQWHGPIGTSTDWTLGTDNWMVYIDHPPTPSFMQFAVEEGSIAANNAEASANVDVGEWNHMICVWDPDGAAGNAIMYINGIRQVNVGTRGALAEAMAIPMFVGKWAGINTAANAYWNGYAAEIAIWGGPVTDDEAFAIYNDGTPPDLANLTGFTTDLVAWYNGVGYNDAAPGNPIVDKSGNGNDAVDAGTGGQITLVADVP